MAVGADILAVLLSLSVVSCLFSEGLECGSSLAVLLSLSVVSCLFSEGLECGSRGRYPRCAIVSLSG